MRIKTRNSRMPDALAADLDAECSACLMGARRLTELFERYGVDTVESCFDAMMDATTETYRREILSKNPGRRGTRGRTTPSTTASTNRCSTFQRITLTKTRPEDEGGERLILDFNGTGPQAKGPINHCGDYADGNFLIKWWWPRFCVTSRTPRSAWPNWMSTRASYR